MIKTVSHYYELLFSQKKAYEMSPKTLNRLETIWRLSLKPFWGNINPEDVDQNLIISFMNWHKENRPNVQLVNVFKYLGNIFNVMIENGALDSSKKPKLDLPKEEQKHHAKQKGRYLSDAEFNVLMKHANGWFELFLSISFCTGMRKMEIGKLEICRLNKIGNRYVAILETSNTKTGKARQVPLPEFLTEAIDKQIKNGSNYLFPNLKRTGHISESSIFAKWVSVKKKAGVQGRLRMHDLRHVCASNLAKSGISPIIATTLLGMSLQTFQKTYLISPEDLFVASDSATMRLKKLVS